MGTTTMKQKFFGAAIGLVGLAFAGAFGTPALAQSAMGIERSGNVFHKAACSHVVAPGDAYCHARVVTDAAGNEKDGKNGNAAPNVAPGGFGPASLKAAYKVSGTGTGIIAIVDAYGYPNAEADLNTYRAQYGLGACTTANGCFRKVDQNGGTNYPRTNTGWDQEQALDVDMASAMCPTCKILLVQASSASLANLATAVNTAAGLGAVVISNSYGGGEAGSSAYASAYDHAGIAVTVSSGDSGYGVQFPASAPGAIAVGGTHLVADSSTARGWTETVWTGAGSGCSGVYTKPSFQTGAACGMRVEADISAVADPATGVAVYGPTGTGTKTGWLVFGGTSVSAPLVGGIYAAYGVLPSNGASAIWANRGAGQNDVTVGSNGTCGGTYLCTAGVGYDGPTGWGTPNGATGL
ncbi:MAG: S53 family peptidase [Novosphingobium sp.]|nr:S53 family peptidase [Novosphingobium sp.]